MGLLAPWFLAGLVALGVPIYVHLLRRHTTTPRPFSSLMFFERGTQSSTRHRRLRYLLLFALRSALLLLLVLAFANPFVRRASAGPSSKLLLVVIDNSFSMRQGTRLADSKQDALRVLQSRPKSEPAQVMALGGGLQVLTQPVTDSGVLHSAVESIQPSDSHGTFSELAQGIRAISGTVRTPVVLHLFSDMQKTDMPGNFADMALPANVSLVLHQVGKSGAPIPNWTVESLNAPALLGAVKDAKTSRVQAVIAGYGTPAASRTVSLLVNGKTVATRNVNVPANGRASVDFQSLDVPYGLNRCEVKIDPADSFPADDGSVFAVKRSDPERVLFVHQARDSRSPFYFGSALAAAAQASFVLQPVTVEQAAQEDPSKYAFVVLSDALALPSHFENALLRYVRGGGGVLIAAGTSAAHQASIPLWGGSVLDARDYSRDGGFASIGQADLTHPAMSVEGAGKDAAASAEVGKDAAGWSDPKFYYVSQINAGNSRVIARLTDGTPLLLDRQVGDGHVLLLASGLDNLTNDLPLHPVFVPFVDTAARYLSGIGRLEGSRVAGSYIQLRSSSASPKDPVTSVEVVDPDGRRPLSLSEAKSIRSYQLTRAGFYRVRFANGADALIGVNPDRRESDLTVVPQNVLRLWSGNAAGRAQQPSGSAATPSPEKPLSLWWYAMFFGLLVAIAESIAATRHLGTLREDV